MLAWLRLPGQGPVLQVTGTAAPGSFRPRRPPVRGHAGRWDASNAGGSSPLGGNRSEGKLAAGFAAPGQLCAFVFGGFPKKQRLLQSSQSFDKTFLAEPLQSFWELSF